MWGVLRRAEPRLHLGQQAGDTAYCRFPENARGASAGKLSKACRFPDDNYRTAEHQRLYISAKKRRQENMRYLSRPAEAVQELAILAGQFEKPRHVEQSCSEMRRHQP